MPKPQINRSIEEVVLIASAVIVVLSITPFAIYRYFNGQFIAAFFELLCITIMGCIGTYVWRTRKTEVMSVVTSIFMLGGLVIFNYILSSSILFWIYPIIMTVYFINTLKVSALLVTPTMLALIPLLVEEKKPIEVFSILITLIICQLFGFLLSRKIKEQYDAMEDLVNRDGLTGASNRRAFEERINFLCDLSTRQKLKQESVVSLIILDIDNFKSINDKFGHTEGDNILRNLTTLFQNNIRAVDQFYRYGGEEFIIIANSANALKATELAEKLRSTLESSQLSELTLVTASFGVAELNKHEQPKRWIERADKAMYRAKRAGRNRVFIANFAKGTNHNEEVKLVTVDTV